MEFTVVHHRKRRVPNSKDTPQKKIRHNNDEYERTKARIVDCMAYCRNEPMIQSIVSNIKNDASYIKCIRCLGLGNLNDGITKDSIYQFCLLNILVDELQRDGQKIYVSVWDPVFNEFDRNLIEQHYHYKIEEENSSDVAEESTFYYMPHLPDYVMEKVFASCHPRLMICNEFSSTKYEAMDPEKKTKFINCLRIGHILENSSRNFKSSGNGWKYNTSTRHRRRKHKPSISNNDQYRWDESYFSKADIVYIPEEESKKWGYAFNSMGIIRLH